MFDAQRNLVGMILSLLSLASGCEQQITANRDASLTTPVATSSPDIPRSQDSTRFQETNRHYEKQGGFSYIPPDGCEKNVVAGMMFAAFATPAKDGNMLDFQGLSMSVGSSQFDGSLMDFIEHRKKILQKNSTTQHDVSISEPVTVVTALKQEGYRTEYRSRALGQQIVEPTYYFEQSNSKIVLIFNSLAVDAEKYRKAIDNCVLSFRFD